MWNTVWGRRQSLCVKRLIDDKIWNSTEHMILNGNKAFGITVTGMRVTVSRLGIKGWTGHYRRPQHKNGDCSDDRWVWSRLHWIVVHNGVEKVETKVGKVENFLLHFSTFLNMIQSRWHQVILSMGLIMHSSSCHRWSDASFEWVDEDPHQKMNDERIMNSNMTLKLAVMCRGTKYIS